MATYTRDQYGNRYRVVRARRRHICDNRHWGYAYCDVTVEPGQQYLRHVGFPSDDLGLDGVNVFAECMGCARYVQREGLSEVAPDA